MSLGHTSTQFCALPQSTIPPRPMMLSSRSAAFMRPVGWELKSRTCASGAGPMKSELSLYCGQTSIQHPQVMQRENA
jgi:hypothetical protein